MYNGAKEAGAAQVTYFETLEALKKALEEKAAELLPKGCTVLIKASHGMHFSELVELLTCRS